MEPLHKIEKEHKKAKLIIFDLDGTLTPSKSDMDKEMAELIKKLLEKKMVAVIGGGKYEQFQKQFLARLFLQEASGNIVLFDGATGIPQRATKDLVVTVAEPSMRHKTVPTLPLVSKLFQKLFLFPTSGSSFYRYNGRDWEQVYAEKLSEGEKGRIYEAFVKTFQELNYSHPEKVYGEIIEDRGTQVTFSALGQEAPVPMKEEWNKKYNIERLKMMEILQKHLPDLEVRVGGLTSTDITHKGIDKEYGIRQIKKHLGIDFSEMLFVGDALFPGGNDSAALYTGVPCFEVKGPEDTKKLIQDLLD